MNRQQLGELEDQNLELAQIVQQQKDELKQERISVENEELSVEVSEQKCFLDEINELGVPEIIQLENDNQRLRTLNAALQDWMKFLVSFENLFCIMQSNLDRSRDTGGVVIRSHTKPPLDLIITRLRVIFKIV